MQKIIRSICLFTDRPDVTVAKRLTELSNRFTAAGFVVQTRRVCTPVQIAALEPALGDPSLFCSVGSLTFDAITAQLPAFLTANNTSCNLDLTAERIERKHVELLFDIIRHSSYKTFRIAYVFNNAPSAPFFPSAQYQKNGFAIGLQSTNLAEGCDSLDEWLDRMKKTWNEILALCKHDDDFLGIDSSVAPLFDGHGSLVHFMNRIGVPLEHAATTDFFVRITNFIKEQNPKPTGLCGLMLPCLEDFELAGAYENGQFTIERNLWLSLHSGLGIDTYPIGIDEKPERVLEILTLVQALSKKHSKPLSARFVSDGKAKVGGKSDFGNQYLKDVVVRAL